ncbi:MAG: tRNA 2-selenouridine(34) synthase MnmH [Lachnospirales bacterium]
MRVLSYEKLLQENKKTILVDVRTPNEYFEDHIPTAVNIPLFSNEEHAMVGTLYKQVTVKEAKVKGLEFVASKLTNLYNDFLSLWEENQGYQIVVYCARGGMRSTSIGQLLSTLGMNIIKIDGGYKKYRQYVRENLDNELNKVKFCTLYGKTGCSKTKILQYLEEKGYDTLNLEGFANHRGSLLGHIGLDEQYTQKKFESLLFYKLLNRKSDLLYTEGESKRIGKVILPELLYHKLITESQIEIISPIKTRVKEIKEEYINEKFSSEDVLASLDRMKTYMSNKNYELFVSLLEEKKYDELIEELMVSYYDNVYNDKHNHIIGEVVFDGDFERTIKNIFELSNNIIN